MPSRDDYMSVAKQIASYMNSFNLAFKSYNASQVTEMLQAVAGAGARAASGDTGTQLEAVLLERGFMVYPKIADAEDGYFRVIRTNTIVANLLNSFRYVGANGDDELARLLHNLKRRPRSDDLDSPSAPE